MPCFSYRCVRTCSVSGLLFLPGQMLCARRGILINTHTKIRMCKEFIHLSNNNDKPFFFLYQNFTLLFTVCLLCFFLFASFLHLTFYIFLLLSSKPTVLSLFKHSPNLNLCSWKSIKPHRYLLSLSCVVYSLFSLAHMHTHMHEPCTAESPITSCS